jgi:fructoselysine-6-P-deglycase FrlB-like protein
MSTPTTPPPSGHDLLLGELSRQHADALASFHANGAMAQRIAESLCRNRRLLLVGMGASHFANRAAEAAYRASGIDAAAVVASEILAAPLPMESRSAILVSQSGASGEILDLLGRPALKEERFGLTLNSDSALGRALPCLLGAGGPERAFAATRSLLITLTLHAAVLAALGQAPDKVLASLKTPLHADTALAHARLADSPTFILSGRRELQGVAEAGALFLMELARVPAFALEGGQFRHGPLEALSPNLGVVLLRGADEWAEPTGKLGEICVGAGTVPVVFDASGQAPIAGAVTLAFPALEGLAAAIALLPTLQQLFIGLARQRVARVGEPLRSSKVTGRE